MYKLTGRELGPKSENNSMEECWRRNLPSEILPHYKYHFLIKKYHLRWCGREVTVFPIEKGQVDGYWPRPKHIRKIEIENLSDLNILTTSKNASHNY